MMHTFKVGDRVKWVGNGKVEYGEVQALRATYALVTNGCSIEYSNLYPAEGFYPMPGEFVVSDKYRRKVLGVCGDKVFLSQYESAYQSDWDSTYLTACARQQLERNGWRIEGQEPKKKVYSMDEVAKALGVPVDQLEIKKG